MYYLKKSDDPGVRIFKSDANGSALDEPSRDEIAKTLVLYHQALKTQFNLLSKERSEKAKLVEELAVLKERLRAVESMASDVHARPPQSARTRETAVASAQPLSEKKRGLLRAVIDQNKQLREEISHG
jgi:F0F1-type ATP synthase delta subunit